MHQADVDAAFLEEAAALHEAHHAAAAGRAIPGGELEPARRARIEVGGRLILQGLEGGDDLVAEGVEPGPGPAVAIGEGGGVCHGTRGLGNPSVWRNASERPMAAETVRLRERASGARGISNRA